MRDEIGNTPDQQHAKVSRIDSDLGWDPEDSDWRELFEQWADRWDVITNGALPAPEFVIEVHERAHDRLFTGFTLAAFGCPDPYTWIDYAVFFDRLVPLLGGNRCTIGPMPLRDDDDNNIAGTVSPEEFVVRFLPPDPDRALRDMLNAGD